MSKSKDKRRRMAEYKARSTQVLADLEGPGGLLVFALRRPNLYRVLQDVRAYPIYQAWQDRWAAIANAETPEAAGLNPAENMLLFADYLAVLVFDATHGQVTPWETEDPEEICIKDLELSDREWLNAVVCESTGMTLAQLRGQAFFRDEPGAAGGPGQGIADPPEAAAEGHQAAAAGAGSIPGGPCATPASGECHPPGVPAG